MLGGDPVDSPSRVIGLAGVFGLGALNTLHPKGALSSKLQQPAQALERPVRVVADPQVAAKGTLCRLVASELHLRGNERNDPRNRSRPVCQRIRTRRVQHRAYGSTLRKLAFRSRWVWG